MSINNQHSFWGSLSPLGGLTGAGLLLISSARLSWAITTSLGLIWVYGLSTISFASLSQALGGKIFPKTGRAFVFTCIASFYGSLYLFMFWLLSPIAAFEVFFPLLLIPLFCAGSGIVEQLLESSQAHYDVFDQVSDAVSQAAVLSGLLVVFSIIREPLSYCSLSFPGSSDGMITIMYFKNGPFFPIGIFASSCGALLLLGYFTCLYQYLKGNFFRGEIER